MRETQHYHILAVPFSEEIVDKRKVPKGWNIKNQILYIQPPCIPTSRLSWSVPSTAQNCPKTHGGCCQPFPEGRLVLHFLSCLISTLRLGQTCSELAVNSILCKIYMPHVVSHKKNVWIIFSSMENISCAWFKKKKIFCSLQKLLVWVWILKAHFKLSYKMWE